jgi:hypothetical protein
MRPSDSEIASRLQKVLVDFDDDTHPLIGTSDAGRRDSFVRQLIECIRRVRYFEIIQSRSISKACGDPSAHCFDPLKAAILQREAGNLDEAFWLAFLAVHFGKHRMGGWRIVREIYGRLNQGAVWSWANISKDILGFRAWLHACKGQLIYPGAPGAFGNHRKYESLNAYSESGTGAVIQSYIDWIKPPRTHESMVLEALTAAGGDSRKAFEYLYISMGSVRRFGRTARFDFLTMLAKLKLASIVPGIAYLSESTGPLKGARLLFGNENLETLEELTKCLGLRLEVGMQEMEDSLCNWQKSPDKFIAFRG